MVLKEWLPGLNLQEIDLIHSAFWIQIHGLPLEMMTERNAEKIGKVLGNLMEIDLTYLPSTCARQFLTQMKQNASPIEISKPNHNLTYVLAHLVELVELLCYRLLNHPIQKASSYS